MEELEGIRDVYTNVVQVSAGPYDFSLTFGLKDPSTNEDELHTRVRFSPQQARALYLLLQSVIEAYEKNIGGIPLPEELETRLTEPLEPDSGGADEAN